VRLFSILVLVAIVLVVASLVAQAWFVFEVLPQDIRNAQPIIITAPLLVSDGPYVGCFASVTAPALVVHQGESFVVTWSFQAPSNASCTIQSIDGDFSPFNITGSNLPLAVGVGQFGYIQVYFAPFNSPYWGGLALKVIESYP
jgi:hypothetical protein